MTKRDSSPNWYRLAFSRRVDSETRRQAWKTILIAELIVGVVLFLTIFSFMAVTDYATWSVVVLGVFTIVFLGVMGYAQRGKRWDD